MGARFESSLQRPHGELAANEPGKVSGRRADIESKNLKDEGAEYLVQWKSRSHAHDKWVSEKELERIAPKELARFKKLFAEGQVKLWNIFLFCYLGSFSYQALDSAHN